MTECPVCCGPVTLVQSVTKIERGPWAGIEVPSEGFRCESCRETYFTAAQAREVSHNIVEALNARERVASCPLCRSTNILQSVTEWEARSLEPVDRDNVAKLTEHQCQACGKAFWT